MTKQYTIETIAGAIFELAQIEDRKQALAPVLNHVLSNKFTLEKRASKGTNALMLRDALVALGLSRNVAQNYLSAIRFARDNGIKANAFTFNLERLKDRVNKGTKAKAKDTKAKDTKAKDTKAKDTKAKADKGKLKTHGDALELVGQTAANLLKTTEKFHDRMGSDVLEALEYLASLNG